MPAKRTSTRPASGHQEAQRKYRVLGDCELCGVKPARERHHRDGNPLNNERANVAFLCTRCHMVIDGRLERLRQSAPARARRAINARWGKSV